MDYIVLLAQTFYTFYRIDTVSNKKQTVGDMYDVCGIVDLQFLSP